MVADPYRYFRIEARELLGEMSASCVALEKTQGDVDLVAKLLRHAHTLKGAARIVRQNAIGDLAHAVEDLLEPLRAGAAPARLDAVLADIDAMSRKVDELPGASPEPQVVAPAGPAGPARLPAAPAPEPLLPRADTAAIDRLLAALAEVVTGVGRLKTERDPRAAAARVEHIDRELREMRQDVERLRLQPASSLFSTLERAARDAAGADQRVDLVTSGGELRLDAAVLGPIHRALVQLVRNAVAHGIEPIRERQAAGKPDHGQVRIGIRLSGSRVAFSCHDDGRGIDVAAVRRVAERQHGGPLGADELLSRLLEGGLTTATTVTAHAGRGIGLDVVRAVARELGGEVAAATTAGQGSTITITVPVSMTSMHALVVQAGSTAAIPLASVRRVVTVRGDEIWRGATGLTIALDDVILPYRSLRSVLGGGSVPRARHPVVIVHAGDELAAIGVERLLGVEEIVMHPRPHGVDIDPVVWGLALDDEGVPRPVLEPAALVAGAAQGTAEPAVTVRPRAPILIVDDSVTTRMLEQSILESAGYQVELARSAEQALEMTSRRAYALFLVDVEMPGMDGFAFVSTIRSRPALASIPAILVTSRNGPEDKARGAAVGAQGYVVKGEFDQNALLASIRRLLAS